MLQGIAGVGTLGLIIFVCVAAPLLAIAIPGLIIALFVKLLSKSSQKDRGGFNEDETRAIQELNHGFTRMEERIEALETLILENAPTEPRRESVKN